MDLVNKREIKFENYKTTIFQISKDLQFMEREHLFLNPKEEFDVFPESWFLFFPKQASDLVQIKTIFGDLDIPDQSAIFLPPLKLIRWKISPGDIKWYAYRGESALPVELQQEAFMFSFSEIPLFSNTLEIQNFVQKNKSDSVILSSELTGSKAARDIKKILDKDFDSLTHNKISEMAQLLGVKPNRISQAFKKCYGVNPIDYKNRLKLNKALQRMWLDSSANLTSICYDVGFDEYSAFYRNFLKWLKVEPSYILRSSTSGEKTEPEENLSSYLQKEAEGSLLHK